MSYWKFVGTGCLLGLFIEFEFRILGRLNPKALCFAVVCYPMFVSLAYVASRLVDRIVRHQLFADLIHYVGCGIFGLAVEWTLLGNSPWANPKAFQAAMFCMWAAFCFGPRVLLRNADQPSSPRKLVWRLLMGYGLLSIVVAVALRDPQQRFVLILLSTMAVYFAINILLALIAIQAWRSRQTRSATGSDPPPPTHTPI